jgi:hypothetical protein
MRHMAQFYEIPSKNIAWNYTCWWNEERKYLPSEAWNHVEPDGRQFDPDIYGMFGAWATSGAIIV